MKKIVASWKKELGILKTLMAEAMNFYDAVKTRRSVRHYRGTPVPPEKLDRIWEAVRWAPSACNLQPWRFLLVKSAEMRERTQRVLLQDWAVFSLARDMGVD